MTEEADALVFSSASDGRAAAVEGYRELYASGSHVEPTGPVVSAAVRSRLRPGMAVFDRTLHGISHQRDAALVRRTGFDHFTLQHVVSGELLVRLEDDRRRLGPGDALLLDMTKPFAMEAVGCRLHTLSLPRERLARSGMDPAHLHGQAPARGATPAGGALRALMTADEDVDASALLDLVLEPTRRAALLRPAEGADPAARLERACAFIEANLADSRLTPGKVAAGAHISRATLYRCFEELGGVSAWILSRRLRRLRTLLAFSRRPVADLIAELGFVSLSHATSAFQARYGVAPGALRRRRAEEEAEETGPAELTRRILADMPVAHVGPARPAARSAA